MIPYQLPKSWVDHDPKAISDLLVNAKAAVASLKMIPYQRDWVEELQKVEFKREVAGTSRIEGADFTEGELEAAIHESPEELKTRSQRQARAAVEAYRWIAQIPDDRPLTADLVKEIHIKIVTGADDDHCEPGALRRRDENVHFGQPRHRGVNGGLECEEAFDQFARALSTEFKDLDPILQAHAAHYHLGAMHPFLDGNGRTARALEALLLQRAGLRDTCFIAMSNFYYEEKIAYLTALSEVRANGHDLTVFLNLGLKGIHQQSSRLLTQIHVHVSKAIYRNTMYDLFGKLRTARKRVIVVRQLEILKLLLALDELKVDELFDRIRIDYANLKKPNKAFIRDLLGLDQLKAVVIKRLSNDEFLVRLRLEWPTEITESGFMERLKNLPKAKTHSFLG